MFLERHRLAIGPDQWVTQRFHAYEDLGHLWLNARRGKLTPTLLREFGDLIAHEYVEHALMRSGVPYISAARSAWVRNPSTGLWEYMRPNPRAHGAHDMSVWLGHDEPWGHWPKIIVGVGGE